MAITPAVLQAGTQLGTSAAALYTAPANTRAVVKKATFTNTSAGAVTFTVYRVASGGSPGDANTIIKAKSLAANESYTCPELSNQVIGPGDSIQALASAGTSITAVISGFTAT